MLLLDHHSRRRANHDRATFSLRKRCSTTFAWKIKFRIHLAWRWFAGLGFDQEMPHYSSFFQESVTEDSRSRSCLTSCLKRSWLAAWSRDWCKGTTFRSMAVSWRPMP